MVRAVMEGVTFSLQDCMTLVKEMGGEIEEVRASGGGARSELWRSIQADVFNSLIVTVNSVEGPAYGAAILAAVGTGASDTVEDTCERWIRVETKIRPDEERSRLYKKLYSIYRGMYPVLKPAFDDMSSIFEG
jgi:xylulokinase